MPAEWEKHEGTWLAWPHERTDWPGKFPAIPLVYAKIVAKLSRFEMVHILCHDAAEEKMARRLCRREHANMDAVEFLVHPTDRSWVRDTAPIFTVDDKGGLCAVDWHFNGWAKYTNWHNDDLLPEYIGKHVRCWRTVPEARGKRVVLEGGSIDVNGAGTLLTTSECLLSSVQARNPHLTKEEMEDALCRHLGQRKILWLRNGIAGDDTHGHVDDLARFVGPSTVVIASESNKKDANYEPLRENWMLLNQMTNASGEPLKVVKLPMPAPIYYNTQRLPASYANFYIANGQVLVPTFNDPNDRVALTILARLFGDREVVGIDCSDLVLGLGTLHCMTQQQPMG